MASCPVVHLKIPLSMCVGIWVHVVPYVCVGYIHLHVCLYRDHSNTLFLMHVYSCTNAHINTHTRVLARLLLNCA